MIQLLVQTQNSKMNKVKGPNQSIIMKPLVCKERSIHQKQHIRRVQIGKKEKTYITIQYELDAQRNREEKARSRDRPSVMQPIFFFIIK